MTGSTAKGDPRARGLQAERTALAWTRTSFAFLVNGALLAIKNVHTFEGPVGLIPVFLAVAVALGTYMIALRRQRILQQQLIPKQITPRRAVYAVGLAALLLIVVTSVDQLR
ncbi:DUF202 domain-containing protein [Mycobacterium simiae]|uniref:DUF202 domain-containing protein n=1 Tax=Mycobacterium simiae TaxID=1784 RepID=A0A5B1BXL3_MYCSI|nr:DUF202 domain-containing protein [Mycobacterium simiae]KAA1252133.1 DUF202 domain-containing protein [Mycobacterium simiae]